MPKITRGNVAAARARMEILQREGKEVPEIVQRLAALDIDNLDVLDRGEIEKRHT